MRFVFTVVSTGQQLSSSARRTKLATAGFVRKRKTACKRP